MLPDDLLENLDGQWPDDLGAYAMKLVAAEPNYKGADLRTLRKLRAYADTKSIAMAQRKAGDIQNATRHEAQCDAIYNSLPKYARW